MKDGRWKKTTEDSDFVQWTFIWKEKATYDFGKGREEVEEEVFGTDLTVRYEFGVWNLYVDNSIHNKLPITKHTKSKTEALELAKEFRKKYPRGY